MQPQPNTAETPFENAHTAHPEANIVDSKIKQIWKILSDISGT